jgi:hypothetical protein
VRPSYIAPIVGACLSPTAFIWRISLSAKDAMSSAIVPIKREVLSLDSAAISFGAAATEENQCSGGAHSAK